MKLFKNKTISFVHMIWVILNKIRTKQTRMHAYYIIFAYALKLSEFEVIYFLSCAKKAYVCDYTSTKKTFYLMCICILIQFLSFSKICLIFFRFFFSHKI